MYISLPVPLPMGIERGSKSPSSSPPGVVRAPRPIVETSLNEHEYGRIERAGKRLGISTYKFVKIAVLRLAAAVERGEFRMDEDEGK